MYLTNPPRDPAVTDGEVTVLSLRSVAPVILSHRVEIAERSPGLTAAALLDAGVGWGGEEGGSDHGHWSRSTDHGDTGLLCWSDQRVHLAHHSQGGATASLHYGPGSAGHRLLLLLLFRRHSIRDEEVCCQQGEQSY